jgi:hypothetical protein
MANELLMYEICLGDMSSYKLGYPVAKPPPIFMVQLFISIPMLITTRQKAL